jgi:hypothetical protein
VSVAIAILNGLAKAEICVIDIPAVRIEPRGRRLAEGGKDARLRRSAHNQGGEFRPGGFFSFGFAVTL